MAKQEARNNLIGLDELQLENNDLFVRLNVDNMSTDAKVIVQETHWAILLKDGKNTGVLEAGKHDIFDTVKRRGFFGTKEVKIGADRVELIYISRTCKLQVFWGTHDLLEMRDTITGIPFKLGAGGDFEVRVKNPSRFYAETVGSDKNYTLEDLKKRLQMRFLSEVEEAIAVSMKNLNLSYAVMSENKKSIGNSMLPVLKDMFDEYGLEMIHITLARVMMDDKDKARIESKLREKELEEKNEIERLKKKKEQEEEEAKRKAEIKELAAELERLDDKQFERDLLLRKIDQEDHQKYLEVCKAIGWESGAPKKADAKVSVSGKYCPHCGAEYTTGAKFCGGCGGRLPGYKVICPKCKAENPSGSKFCSECGEKL
jgi:membrane protease subunit (stomatin/prohibitin family)